MIPLFILAAVMGGVPNVDIDKMCQRELSVTNDTAGLGGCVQDEKASRDRLQKLWPSYPAAVKQECISNIGGDLGVSYTEIETCFQMQDWKKNLDDIGGTHVPGAHGPQLK
jgi:hypothetical protein